MEGRLYTVLAILLLSAIISTVSSRSLEDSDGERGTVSEQNVNEIEQDSTRVFPYENNNEVPANTMSGIWIIRNFTEHFDQFKNNRQMEVITNLVYFSLKQKLKQFHKTHLLCTLTYTYAQTKTITHTYTRMHTLTHARTHTPACTHTRAHAHTLPHMH